MLPGRFIESADAVRILERAARAAAVPMAIHGVGAEHHCSGDTRPAGGPRIHGWGHCQACRFVNGMEAGREACRADRVEAGHRALGRALPVPFICHMGFACIAVSLQHGRVSTGYVLTLGPYYPPQTAESLEVDARTGLAALQAVPADGPLPFVLDDVPEAAPERLVALAAWLTEDLARLEHDTRDAPRSAPEQVAPEDTPASKPKRGGRYNDRMMETANAIVTALAGANTQAVRSLTKSVLCEAAPPKRPNGSEQQVRNGLLVLTVVDAAGRAGWDMDLGAAEAKRFFLELDPKLSGRPLVEEMVRFFRRLKRDCCVTSAVEGDMARFNEILMQRLADGVTLREVALELGKHPTAVTHWLQRNHGLSFSQYVGRLRVDRGKELLRRTSLPITEIALRVGVADASNFGKLFRKFESMSPTEYRSKYGVMAAHDE